MVAQITPLPSEFMKVSEIDKYIQVYTGCIYYTENLLHRFGILERVLKTRRSEYKHGRSKNYAFIQRFVEGRIVRLYDALTIPQQTFLEYNLPTIESAAALFSKAIQRKYAQLEIPPDTSYQVLKAECMNTFQHAYRYLTYFYHIDEHTPNIQGYAEKYAILRKLISYTRNLDHGIIRRLFDLMREPEFRCLNFPDNLKTFYGYLERARQSDNLVQFVLGKQGLPSNRLKVNEAVENLVCYLKSHPNPITTDRIRIWTNTILIACPEINGSKLLSTSKVQEVIDKHENRISIMREGEEKIRKAMVGYFDIVRGKNPFDQFQFDEWYIEFACKKSGKRTRKILLSMMDACTGKIIHRIIVDGLNQKVIKKFLHESVLLCNGRVPAEYVCDFASYNVAGDIKHAMNYLKKKYKEKFHWTVTSNANRKAIKERYYRTIGSLLLSPIIGSLGDGLTAKRDNAHPAHIIELYLNDPKYLQDETELERILYSVIDRYGRNAIHRLKLSPNEKFESMKAVNALQLEPREIAYMFHECEKRTMKRARVRLHLGDMTRFYSCFNYKVAFDNGADVDCYFSDINFKTVFVYEHKSDRYIGLYEQYHSFHGAKINQVEEDRIFMMELFEKREKMVEDLMNEKPRTAEALSKVTGGFPIGDFVQGLTNITLPPPSTDVSTIIPGVMSDSPAQIDPFNIPEYKKMKKATRKEKETIKKEDDARATIMSDTLRSKLA